MNRLRIAVPAILALVLSLAIAPQAAFAQAARFQTSSLLTDSDIDKIAAQVKAKGASHDTNAELAEANPPGGPYAAHKFYLAHPILIGLANQGNAHATLLLGLLYNTGFDLDPRFGGRIDADLPKAIRLFRIAAEADDPFAQRQLSDFYNIGRGVPKDAAEAARWHDLFAHNKMYAGATTTVKCFGPGPCPK